MTCQGDDKPIIKAIWTLDTCAPIVGSDVLSFKDERELLRSWGKFLRSTDPDLLIGYNIVNFDFPYLINRAATLGVEDFPYWGRMIGSKLRMKDTTFSSKAYGTRDSKEITIEGRVQFDLLQAVQRDHKLSSYSLNAVSAHFLGEQKEDVHHSAISELQAGTAETRRRLAVYCLKDAYLPQRLLDKLMYMYNYIEMARVTGVPLSFLLSRGQSIKVMSQILRKAAARAHARPAHAEEGRRRAIGGWSGVRARHRARRQGGVLRAPHRHFGFRVAVPVHHDGPQPVLLHPRARQRRVAHGAGGHQQISHRRRVRQGEQDQGNPAGDFGGTPLGAQARKRDLKKAQDPLEKAVLDGRQLALKVSANSVYGFTGATVGQLPCLEISSSTTSYGTWPRATRRCDSAIPPQKSVERVFLEKFRNASAEPSGYHPHIVRSVSGNSDLVRRTPTLARMGRGCALRSAPYLVVLRSGSDAALELLQFRNGRRTSGGGGGSFR